MPKRAAIAVLLILVCSLSACAMLPSSGPVYASDSKMLSNRPQLGLRAPGPVPDASAIQIVAGFIRACSAGYTDDFSVARSFLVDKTAVDWRPNRTVRIFPTDTALEVQLQRDGSVLVTAQAVGEVNSHGTYRVAGTDEQIRASFSLVKAANNQWRIANLEDGVLLSQAAFSSLYASAPVYFLTVDKAELVPDLRWFPRRVQAVNLVKEMLAGPPEWLKDAAVSAFPAGSSLRGSVVDVFETVANVSLNMPSMFPDDRHISLAYLQLESTLKGIPEINSVNLSIGDSSLENPRPITPTNRVQQPIMIQGGNIIQLQVEGISVVASGNSLGNKGVAHPAISIDGETIAFTDAAHTNVYVWNRGQPYSILHSRGVLPPAVDRLGWIWSGVRDTPDTLEVMNTQGARLSLKVPLANRGVIRQFALSPDGTRIALLYSAEGQDYLSVATVYRDGAGIVQRLASMQRVAIPVENILSLSWLKGYSLAILSVEDGESTVRLVPLYGPPTTLPGIKDAVELAAGEEENELYIATSNGNLYRRAGRNWQQELTDISDPNYPG